MSDQRVSGRTLAASVALALFTYAACSDRETPTGPQKPALSHGGGGTPYCASDVIRTIEGATKYSTFTFEHAESDEQCLIYHVGDGVTFGDTANGFWWRMFRDDDGDHGGGSFDFGNMVTPTNAASTHYSSYQGEIIFDDPVSSIELYFNSLYDVRFTAYNSFWFVLDQVVMPANEFGDGVFDEWDLVQLSASGQQIARLFIDYPAGPTGAFFIDNLRIARAVQPLDINCTSVTRANPSGTTCTIDVPPGSTIDSVSEWRFDGVDQVGDTLTVRDSANSSASWSGVVVLSGTVSATVYTDGNSTPEPAMGQLDVLDRGWQWGDTDWNFSQGGGPACVAYTPYRLGTAPATLGQNMPMPPEACNLLDIIAPSASSNIQAGYSVAQVPSGGPNAALWYVATASWQMNRGSSINPDLLSSAPQVQLVDSKDIRACKNKTTPAGYANWHEFNTLCKKNGNAAAGFVQGVWDHEEYGSGPNGGVSAPEPNGHQARLEKKAAEPIGDPHYQIEPLVADADSSLRTDVENAVVQTDGLLLLYMSDHTYVRDNWCGAIWVFNVVTDMYERFRFPQDYTCP